MSEDVECGTDVAAARLALGLDTVEPRPHLGGCRRTPGHGAGSGHTLDHRSALTGPSGDKRTVGQDCRTEQRLVGFLGGLEGADVCLGGLVGFAQVEELDAPGHQAGFGQCAGEDGARQAGRLGEERGAEAGVLDDRGVHLGGLHGPVKATVRGGDDRVVGGNGGGLAAGRGCGRQWERGDGADGAADSAAPTRRAIAVPVRRVGAPGGCEAELLDGQGQDVGEDFLVFRTGPRWCGGLPAADLSLCDCDRCADLASGGREGFGEVRLGGESRRLTC